VKIRPREPADQAAAQAFLARHNSLRGPGWGNWFIPWIIRRLSPRPPAGACWACSRTCRRTTGGSARSSLSTPMSSGVGAGTALIEAVGQLARQQGCTRLWVITTNDNVDALRFYQRRGFCLVAVHRGAVDRSRARLKPEIPAVGAYGIPLRDEIELEKQP